MKKYFNFNTLLHYALLVILSAKYGKYKTTPQKDGKFELNWDFCFIIVIGEIPQPFDYVGRGFHLDCYECHSNRPGCGPEIDWILSRWKHCDMPAPKCIKIIERLEGNVHVSKFWY